MPLECQGRPYHILIYQLPDATAAARMSIWRALKRLGALSLQQSVYILPSRPRPPGAAPPATPFDGVTRRIAAAGGTYHLLPLYSLPPGEEAKISAGFRAQSGRQYEEITAYCAETIAPLVAEVAAATIRQTLAPTRVDGLRREVDQVRCRFDRVVAQDWCGAAGRAEARHQIERCAALLAQVAEPVCAAGATGGAPADCGATQPPMRRRRVSRCPCPGVGAGA